MTEDQVVEPLGEAEDDIQPALQTPQRETPQSRWREAILLVAIIAFTAWFTYLSHARWSVMLSSMGDLGHIDSAAYNTAHGEFMLSTGARTQNMWGDHFSPVILILTAFYLFSDSFWFIYFWQALSAALVAVPLYLIAKDRLGGDVALLAALAYLLNSRLHMAVLFDYHEAAHVGLFALSAFYCATQGRWRWFALFGALLLSCREDSALILFSIGVYIALFERKWIHGAVTCVAATIYFLALMKLAFPYFRANPLEAGQAGDYMYFTSYAWLGASPWEVVKNFFHDPATMLSMIFHPQRIAAWAELATQYAYLPFATLSGMLLMAFPTLSLLLNNHEARWSLIFHYPFLVVPFWTLGFVLGLDNLRRWLDSSGVGGVRPEERGKVYGVLTALFGLVAAIQGAGVLMYALSGPFDVTYVGMRVYMSDPIKPMMIFVISLSLALVLMPFRTQSRNDISSRVVFVICLYAVAAGAYYSTAKGALPPVSGEHQKYFEPKLVAHAARAQEVLSTLPRHASAVFGQGPYTLALHNPNGFLFRRFNKYPFGAKDVDYLVLDVNTPVDEPLPIDEVRIWVLRLLLAEPGYAVIHHDDGVYVFKRGAKKEGDYQAFIDYGGRFPARVMGDGVGELLPDESAIHGASRRATPGVHPSGYLASGPYAPLYAGEYTAVFRLKVGALMEAEMATLDVAFDGGKKTLAQRRVGGSD
ncbi:MAG: DUF2079 domain-containing protein, partial [Nitrospinota bacterium]|nr:DUF2079 domain-containing protein [Nitrospinota bacterium]